MKLACSVATREDEESGAPVEATMKGCGAFIRNGLV